MPHTMLLDDTVGALTRSVYDASAGTDAGFSKMLTRLHDLNMYSDKFNGDLTLHSSGLANATKLAKLMTGQALESSKRITNGVSDDSSAHVLNRLIRDIEKSNRHLIDAIKEKNYLKETLRGDGRVISESGRDVASRTQKGFAVVSVARRICANAEAMQHLSKSLVDRAERVHLAHAAPQFEKALNNIKSILQIERKFLPIVLPNAIVPAKVSSALDDAYASNTRSIELAKKALEFSGSARAREVVDLRDELRNSLDKEQDVIDMQAGAPTQKILTQNTQRNATIDRELVPEIHKFKAINRTILKEIDRNRSIQIDASISKKVLKQSGLSNLGLVNPGRKKNWAEFL